MRSTILRRRTTSIAGPSAAVSSLVRASRWMPRTCSGRNSCFRRRCASETMIGWPAQRGTLCAAIAAAIMATCVVVIAQSNRWYDPYDQGRKAFEAGKYAEAVPLLERAVAAEPKAAPNKIIEGVFRTDYFPYYYLALAYAELRQWNKASENLDKARPTLTRQQTAAFNDAESKIKLALNPAPQPPTRNAAFDTGVRQAEAALGNRNYQAAIRQLDQLRTLDANEYAKAGLAAKRDEAVK